MSQALIKALEASDAPSASKQLEKKLSEGGDAWKIHLDLFPMAQRVLNPPFINPHLPKMYRIIRELAAHLNDSEIQDLVKLETIEYARRPKLDIFPEPEKKSRATASHDLNGAIREQDHEKTAVLMAGIYTNEGAASLARKLLLLGSGYLDQSLGHAVSCTAFILLEMMEREDQYPWPALVTLADYFCKGRFCEEPKIRHSSAFLEKEALQHHLLRAASGRGIVNLHHTITLYAMNRVRLFFSASEYNHLLGAWVAFMGNKKAAPVEVRKSDVGSEIDYSEFFEIFSGSDPMALFPVLWGMIHSEKGRKALGRFLIKGVCDRYQGQYDPHYITGLGSALWVVDQFRDQPQLAVNALYQYLDFLFEGLTA